MSKISLKQLFLVAFLGLTLVGCSSTPTSEEETAAETATEATSAEATETKDAGEGSNVAEEKAAVATNADGLTADEILALIQGKVVSFDFDRSEVKDQFYQLIKLHADYMSLVPDATLTVQGHCDERGTKEYNLALGERRADAVKSALVAEGVSPSRLNTISFGEENPVDPGHDEMAWSKNRRAEFVY